MTVGGRIYLKKDNSGLELVKAFAKIPTANIADTMGRSCAMHPRIKLFSSPHGTVWAGIALTVKSRGGDNLLIHAALDMAREGDVIVVSNEGGVDNRSLMGEIMFTYAAYKKLNGLVLDGPIRDVKSAKEIPLPIYATGSTPGGPYKEGPGEINVPISCGGISVNPGDIDQILMVIIISTIMSIAAPGIPGGGIVTGAIFLNLLGLPMDLMGPIAGMYRLIDMSHTTVNVSGDVLGTMLVAKNENIWTGEDFNKTLV